MKKVIKCLLAGLMAATLLFTLSSCGAGNAGKQVVIYSNADDEAMNAMKAALDSNGYAGKYLLQSFGTSELGGKLLAEGKNIEADLVTMSSFYLDSAQSQNQMFADLSFDPKTLAEYPSYYSPITAQEGAIILNTQVLEEAKLDRPVSVADLAKEEYRDNLSVTDILSSSTAWLLVQDVLTYDEVQAREIMTGILENAGDHLESSGSAPLKKLRAGEVAVGFGLRHQAVADKEAGLPIDYVDPSEGNFSLTESVAVLDKGTKQNPLAMEMAQCIIENARPEIIKTYPIPLYEGETADEGAMSLKPTVYPQALTAELLKEHQDFSESCKKK